LLNKIQLKKKAQGKLKILWKICLMWFY